MNNCRPNGRLETCASHRAFVQRRKLLLSTLVPATLTLSVFAAIVRATPAPEAPSSPDGSAKVSLFAAEPEIVTPIGATVDSHGRLLVIESHTHFRPKNYQGPPTDRIRILEDSKGEGKADRISSLYEGGKFLMNLAADRDGSIVVSSRNEIFRLADTGEKLAAPRPESAKITLAHLETTADYPHNGLHGLAIDKDSNVYFGIGENLGGPWTLVGADGQKLADFKGSGAVFRVDSQGRGLTLIARGFWNPFGLGFDPAGNLWAVDNDPDGRPPSRLIQVVPGADYGFEFRYGRTGMHPLQAWDGELPGTLGMIAGVGEAPCAVQWRRDRLFVSSWRDHQVQAFALTPRGASFAATMQPLLTGPDTFRPVGLAFAPDGSLYVGDWGSASYAVNGVGRIWKVTFAHPATADTDAKPTEAMGRAAHLRQSDQISELLAALDDSDPYTAQAAQFGLSRLPQAEKIDFASLSTPRQRIGLLTALLWRGSPMAAYIPAALKDDDDRLRQMAVRAVAEQNITEARESLNGLLSSQVLSPRLLGMTVAALNQLDGAKDARIDPAKISGVLLARINSPEATDQTKATALHMLQQGHPRIPDEQLQAMLKSPLRPLQLEAVRYLSGGSDAGRFPILAELAADPKADPALRAEAIVGLSDDAAGHVDLLLQGARGADINVRDESLRSLRPAYAKMTPAQQAQLADVATQYPAESQLVHRAMGEPLRGRPPETDIFAWQKVLDEAPGDPEAGRRIFFHPAAAGCFRCHMLEGRGRAIGPDLTMIGHSQTREHVLESILDPSREIAPLFTLWSIKTKSGDQIDGMLLRRDGQSKEVYVDSSGKETTISEPDIIDRKIRKESLMPTGLVQALTDQELRDLVALLMQKR